MEKSMFQYENMHEGLFLSRPNRFIAYVEQGGKRLTCHVKNTGRCRELLQPGVRVWCQRSDNPSRKTKFDLITVEKGGRLINMDSQIVNDVAGEWLPQSGLFSEKAIIHREVTYGNSRFDFYVEDGERRIFLEVKGCTLEKNGIAMFPDAPTTRGVKHIEELATCMQDGYEACILFVIALKGVNKPVRSHRLG